MTAEPNTSMNSNQARVVPTDDIGSVSDRTLTVPQDTRLVRSFPSGATIHLRGCPRAGRVVPWAWAEGRDDTEWVVKADLKPCRSCLRHLAELQDELRRRAGVPS